MMAQDIDYKKMWERMTLAVNNLTESQQEMLEATKGTKDEYAFEGRLALMVYIQNTMARIESYQIKRKH